jgi:hypothetical protein
MMAALAQQRVLQAYIAHMFGIVGGSRWAAAERVYGSNPYHSGAALNLSKAVTDIPDIGTSLLYQYETMKDAAPKEHAARLAEVLKSSIQPVRPIQVNSAVQRGVRSWVKSKSWQAEFALRFASAPETVEYWANTWFVAGLESLLDNSLLARAARFIVLATGHHLQKTERNQHTSLYAGWDWT